MQWVCHCQELEKQISSRYANKFILFQETRQVKISREM